jgi:ParB/RepB/Spo0J family partition protein
MVLLGRQLGPAAKQRIELSLKRSRCARRCAASKESERSVAGKFAGLVSVVVPIGAAASPGAAKPAIDQAANDRAALITAVRLNTTGPLFIDCKSIEFGNNPRETFDVDELQGLVESMTKLTLIAPVTVTPAGTERFRLVAGERRLRAARLAGWPELLVEMRADENLARVDLNPIERARQIAELVNPIANGGAGKTLTDVAKRYGHRQAWGSKQVALLKLPAAWQKRVAAGELSVLLSAGRLQPQAIGLAIHHAAHARSTARTMQGRWYRGSRVGTRPANSSSLDTKCKCDSPRRAMLVSG